jgi:hypothetical protein
MTTDIEEQLAAGMREYAGQLRLHTSVVAAAARRHRRRKAVLRCAAGAGTLAVVAAVALAFAAPSRIIATQSAQPSNTSPRPSAATTQTRTVAYVTAQVLTALASDNDKIQHVTWLQVPGDILRGETWGDPTTHTDRGIVYHLNGTAEREFVTVVSGGQSRMTVVQYDTHTYRQQTDPATNGENAGRTMVNPVDIRRWMSDRSLYGVTIVGTEQVDGVSTLHLRIQSENSPDIENLWVDDTSYEVVRQVRTMGGITFQADVEWLPRTPENLALLTLVPPTGFTRAP